MTLKTELRYFVLDSRLTQQSSYTKLLHIELELKTSNIVESVI